MYNLWALEFKQRKMGISSMPAAIGDGSEDIVSIPVHPVPANDLESSGVVDVSAFREENGSGVVNTVKPVLGQEMINFGSGLMRHIMDIRSSLRNIVFGTPFENGLLEDVSVSEFKGGNKDMDLRRRLVSTINEANQIERMFRAVVNMEAKTAKEMVEQRAQFDFILHSAKELAYGTVEEDTRTIEERYPNVHFMRRSGGEQDEVRMKPKQKGDIEA